MRRGDLVVFYRSGDERAARFVGVVEETLRSSDPAELTRFVGTRTVYTADEIEEQASAGRREVLAILFRQARHLHPGWPERQLIDNGVLVRAPQSIQGIPDQGARWIRMKRVALLSIKPDYATAIFAGRKRVEFQRTRIAPDIGLAIVYATLPVGQVLGWFRIANVVESTPDGLWRRYRHEGAIGRRDYFA